MVVEKLNERGRIRRLGDNPEFSFNYTSNFYGECTFTGRVRKSWDHGLMLDGNSVELQHHLVQRGTREGLLRSAEVFFNTVLHKMDSLDTVEGAPLAPDSGAETGYRWQRLTAAD